MATHIPLVLIGGGVAQLPAGDNISGVPGGDALTTNPLSQFAATTSAQLRGVISDETGGGALVFSDSPVLTGAIVNNVTITSPGATLSVPSSATVSGTNTGDQTNITGNAATVTTNANLTGPITSVGNATAIADPGLSALSGLTSAADKVPYFTGLGTASTADFTAAGRALVDDANAAAQRSTLGLGSVDNTSDASKPISTATQTALDLKQNLDSELTAIAGLTSAADKVPYFTGSGTASVADFSSAGRALVDDANAAAQRTTLGLGNVDNTSDLNKPISTATQAVLNTVATTANPMIVIGFLGAIYG